MSTNREMKEKHNNCTEEQRYKLLTKRNNNGKLIEYAKFLLTDEVISIKGSYAVTLTSLLEKENLVKQVGSELVGVLNDFISGAAADVLRDISLHFLESIRLNKLPSGKSLEVLGRVLATFETSPQTVSCDGEEFTGAQYRSHFINKICNIRWPPDNILHIGQMFQDITVTQAEMSFVIEKICSSLLLVKYEVVPQIVHLLLLFAAKGYHKKVVAGLTEYFNNPKGTDSNSDEDLTRDVESELSQAEGTSLLHISFAVKHDLELGKAISQHIKSTKKLTPFTTGLGLSLAQEERFSEQILSALKSGVSRSLRGSKLWTSSKFIHGILEEDQNVKKLLETVLQKSSNGWDYVTEGLIKLGFILLDCSGLESNIGVFILEECYKVHVHCRSSVLTDLLHRIVTSSPLSSGTQHSLLLMRISRRSVQLLLSHSNKLKDSLSNVPLIPLTNARCVLRAIVPVMRYDTSLRDAAILIFRKSLFSKNPDSRRIAVFGLTEMMKKFKVGENYSQSSQLSCSQVQVHLMVTDDVNEAVCTEILLLLKRGLTQQGTVRSDIYDRMSGILTHNSKLYPMILQLLEEQLLAVTEQDPGILPPVKLGHCIAVLPDQSVLREPVMNLLRAAFTCCHMIRSREPDEVAKLDEILEQIVVRSSKCDLEDWDLDKGAEFSNTGVGSRNSVTALTLTAVLEVLLENVLVGGKGTVESGERFKKLFRSMYSVQEILSEKQGGGRGKKAKPGPSHFSLSAVDTLLEYLVVNEMTEHEEFVGNLRTVTHLLTWSLGLLSEHLKRVGSEEEDEALDRQRVYTLGSITKSLVSHLSRSKSLYREQTASLLDKSIRVVTTHHMDLLEEYCDTATTTSDCVALRDQITSLFNKAVLSEDYTECQHLLSAMDVLYNVSETQGDLEEILIKLLDNSSLTSGFAKDVVTVLLTSYRRSTDKLDVHLPLARDILSVLGDIEVEEEDGMTDEVRYKLVNENSGGKLLSVLLSSIEMVLCDLEWGIQHGCRGDDQSDLLCHHLMQVATVLSVTLTCKSPRSSPVTDLLSRTIKKFYNTFTLLVKRESSHNTHGILKSLEKLAKLVGTTTNQKLYCFLIYLEQPDGDDSTPNVATIRKQAVSVPGIVYSVEQCERNLIILSKKTKTDLMEHFKRSPARDFKVDMAIVEEKLTKVEEEEKEESAHQPKKKRMRRKNKGTDE